MPNDWKTIAIGFNIYEGKIVIPFPKWLSNASTKTEDSASMAQSADFSTLKEFVETGFCRGCPRRHPRPCRNILTKKYCRFGSKCMYDHYFECEICENLKHLIEKDYKLSEPKIQESEDIISKMATERDELIKDIEGLKKEAKQSKTEASILVVKNKKIAEKNK